MILDNRTRYRSSDLQSVIEVALTEAGIESHARDRILVNYGHGFSGYCYFGHVTPAKQRRGREARMVLRVPQPRDGELFDVDAFVWLVRHEVAHWRGLDHKQMAPTMRRWKDWTDAGRPLPAWAEGVRVALDDMPPPRLKKPRPDPNDVRAVRIEHARTMLAKSERKAQTAAMLVKRWTRRVRTAEQAIARAAVRAGK